MSWLVATKVVPALRRGEPPDHHAVSVANQNDALPIVWDLKWDMRSIGWAASHVSTLPDGGAVIHSRIQFSDVPKTSSDQGMIYALISDLAKTLQINNRSELSPNGRLERIQSLVQLD